MNCFPPHHHQCERGALPTGCTLSVLPTYLSLPTCTQKEKAVPVSGEITEGKRVNMLPRRYTFHA